MATNSDRIAELEREFAELRRQFEATGFIVNCLYEAGYRDGQASITGQRRPAADTRIGQAVRGSHLHSVGGTS